jgi:hypothetical protein
VNVPLNSTAATTPLKPAAISAPLGAAVSVTSAQHSRATTARRAARLAAFKPTADRILSAQWFKAAY